MNHFFEQTNIEMPDAITQGRVKQVIIINKSPCNVRLRKRQVIGPAEEIQDVEVLPIERQECDPSLVPPGLDNLVPEQQVKAQALIKEYSDLFVQSDLELGQTDVGNHEDRNR